MGVNWRVKHCPQCNKDKCLREFAKDKNRPDGKTYYCRECAVARSREWYRANREKARSRSVAWAKANREHRNQLARERYRKSGESGRKKRRDYARTVPWRKKRDTYLRREFGISLVQWEAMFEAQGRRCAIDKATKPGSRHGWHTDHDHATRKVRGILCAHCNRMLGGAQDNTNTLAVAIRYLEASRAQKD